MRVIILMVAWFILLLLCWPLALVVIVLAPIVWLVSLPFRMLGICVEATFALVRGILLFPAHVLGVKPKS